MTVALTVGQDHEVVLLLLLGRCRKCAERLGGGTALRGRPCSTCGAGTALTEGEREGLHAGVPADPNEDANVGSSRGSGRCDAGDRLGAASDVIAAGGQPRLDSRHHHHAGLTPPFTEATAGVPVDRPTRWRILRRGLRHCGGSADALAVHRRSRQVGSHCGAGRIRSILRPELPGVAGKARSDRSHQSQAGSTSSLVPPRLS